MRRVPRPDAVNPDSARVGDSCAPGFHSMHLLAPFLSCILFLIAAAIVESTPEADRPDPALDAYFRAEAATLSERCLAGIRTLDDWTQHREAARRQLAEMLGLWPMPERTDLKPLITGRLDHSDF